MEQPVFRLISHRICPYVQRAVIVLKEKGIAYERVDIDLNRKPDWFLALSPLGKVPVLLVRGGGEDSGSHTLFESAVIAEYIDTVTGGEMLSQEPLSRANQRAWIEFASALLDNLGQIYNAIDDIAFENALSRLDDKWQHLEKYLSTAYFSGDHFSLVDAAFAPALRYLQVFGRLTKIDFLKAYPKVEQWRIMLEERPSVQEAVSDDYADLLVAFIAQRESLLAGVARTYLEGGKVRAAETL